MIVKPAISFLIAAADALLITMIRSHPPGDDGNINIHEESEKVDPGHDRTALEDFITA